MEQTNVETPVEETYEEKLAKLVSLGIATHEVHVKSDRFKVNEKFKFFNLEDAQEFVRACLPAARETHEESWTKGRYVDSYTGLDKTYSHYDVFQNYDSEVFGKGWKIEVYCRYPRSRRHPENIEIGMEFVYGHRFGAHRMAHPSSKVFIHFGGRDCDGYRWNDVCEYRDLHEAAKACDERYESADGPMGWSVITLDDYESFPL
jgi:hypothetical protein